MQYPVKYIHSGMRGAPVLSGTPGALIGVLDAFLLTGFGMVTAQRVTVSGGVATAHVQSGQSFDAGTVILVAGATPDALNGQARVLTATPSQITFATTAADGAASGTITLKVAPAGGWEKVFAGTNKAVYRSTDVQGSRFYYRIDDSGAQVARVRGFERMTDVDSGDMPFPTDRQVNGGLYWGKSTSADTQKRFYALFADSRFVMVAIAAFSDSGGAFPVCVQGFGDPVALSPAGDVWAACVSGASNEQNALYYPDYSGALTSVHGPLYAARSFAGAGGSVAAPRGVYTGVVGYSGADNALGAAPSAIDGQIKMCHHFFRSAGDQSAPRAEAPGLLHIPQSGVAGSLLKDLDTLPGAAALAGRTLMALGVGEQARGICLVDITGPWR